MALKRSSSLDDPPSASSSSWTSSSGSESEEIIDYEEHQGEEPIFSKPHDIKCFELSMKIWGGGGSGNNAFVAGVKEGLNGEVKDMKVGEEDFCSMYPRLQESVERYANLSEAGKDFIKGSMSLIGSVKAKELEDKWKKLREDEIALYLQQIELIQEQTKLIFEAVKSLNS